MSENNSLVRPTVKVGRRTFTILFPDLLRPLCDSEWSALKASVRKFGVVSPIVIDEYDGIIDGGNRARAAAECGLIDIPVLVENGLDEAQKIGLAFELNDARRHLTPAERRVLAEQRIERVVEARARGESLRVIAEREGVDHQQVSYDLRRAARQGIPVTHPARVIGSDGKSHPAVKDAEATAARRQRVKEARLQGEPIPAIASKEGISVRQVSYDLKAAEGSTPTPMPAPPTPEADPSPSYAQDAQALLTAWRSVQAEARAAFVLFPEVRQFLADLGWTTNAETKD